MANGKCRRVLQFNEYDFRHRQALQILAKHPRGMTELVVNALLHYVACPDAGLEYNKETIRKIVEDVIHEMQESGVLSAGPTKSVPTEAPSSTQIAAEDLNELGGVMSMFRRRD